MPYPPPKKGLGKPQLTRATLLLLQVDVCVKEIFEQGKLFPWPRPPDCPQCHGRLWGHGFVTAYFDGFAGVVFLRRYRCRDCRLTLRLRPLSHWPRFQSSISTILNSLSHRLRLGTWPSGLKRQRQGHWLRSLIDRVHGHLGMGWRGDLLEGYQELCQRGMVPVSRSV